MNSVRKLQALLPVFALAIAPGAHAGSGVIEINADCAVVGCMIGDDPGLPITLAQPGSYRLTSDLTVLALDGTAINGAVDGTIDLDLGGHALIGPLDCPGPPTPCTPATALSGSGVVVSARNGRFHHGSVRGFATGVGIHQSTGTVVEDLTVIGNRDIGINANFGGSDPGDGEVVFRNLVLARNGVGISAASGGSRRATLQHVHVFNSYGAGVSAAGPVFVFDSIFESNVGVGVNANFGSADLISARSAYLRNNGGAANAQFSATSTRNMGGNVCSSVACF